MLDLGARGTELGSTTDDQLQLTVVVYRTMVTFPGIFLGFRLSPFFVMQ